MKNYTEEEEFEIREIEERLSFQQIRKHNRDIQVIYTMPTAKTHIDGWITSGSTFNVPTALEIKNRTGNQIYDSCMLEEQKLKNILNTYNSFIYVSIFNDFAYFHLVHNGVKYKFVDILCNKKTAVTTEKVIKPVTFLPNENAIYVTSTKNINFANIRMMAEQKFLKK